MISNILDPGKMTKRIQFLEVSYTTTNGEPIPQYNELFACMAQKEEWKGNEAFVGDVNPIAISFVHFYVNFADIFRTESFNFEALKIMEIIGTPTVKLDMSNPVLDDFDNPVYDKDSTTHYLYDIIDFQELGNYVGYKITAKQWR